MPYVIFYVNGKEVEVDLHDPQLDSMTSIKELMNGMLKDDKGGEEE
jgi:hypothetical protein